MNNSTKKIIFFKVIFTWNKGLGAIFGNYIDLGPIFEKQYYIIVLENGVTLFEVFKNSIRKSLGRVL